MTSQRNVFFTCISIFTLLLLSQAFVAEEKPFEYQVVVTFESAEAWVILAKPNQQLPQRFKVAIYTNQPCKLKATLAVGGEKESTFEEQIAWRWIHEYTTQKSNASMNLHLRFETATLVFETDWDSLIMYKPTAVPRDFDEYLSPSQIDRVKESLTGENWLKAFFSALIGCCFAILCRYVLMLLDPFNLFNFGLISLSLVTDVVIWPKGDNILWWVIAIVVDLFTYQYIKTARLQNILAYDKKNRNFDLTGVPYYLVDDKLCYAPQSTLLALRRVLLNEHIPFRFKSLALKDDEEVKGATLLSDHTLNRTEPLYLSERAGVTAIEEHVAEEEGRGVLGVLADVIRPPEASRQIYYDVWLRIDPAHDSIARGLEAVKEEEANEKLHRYAVSMAKENVRLRQTIDIMAMDKAKVIAKEFCDKVWQIIFPEQPIVEPKEQVEGAKE